MYPDREYAQARGSFERPVPVPFTEPGDPPLKTIQINCAWLPYVRGALMQLLLQATWDTEDAGVLLQAQERAFNLIDLFQECASADIPFACSFDIEVDGAGWVCYDFGVGSTPECLSDLVPGTGFVSVDQTSTATPGRTYVKAVCTLNFAPTVVEDVVMGYDLLKGDFDVDDGAQTGIILRLAGSNVATQLISSSGDSDGSGKALTWSGSVTADKIIFLIEAANLTSSTHHGFAAIRTGQVNGHGAIPCGVE